MTRNRPINEHIAYLLARATRQVHQQLDEEFRGEGVPVEHWRILKLLVERNGRSMSDLTQAALLNHPTLTKMIDRMISFRNEAGRSTTGSAAWPICGRPKLSRAMAIARPKSSSACCRHSSTAPRCSRRVCT
jgi:hypothetical protein